MDIALPIEIKTREFDGKLWLAMNLADSGHRVALGYRKPMRSDALSHIQPDLFISKSAAKSNSRVKLFEKLNNANCDICVLDAEGGVIRSKADYFENRVGEDILKSVDLFLAWGTEPADVIYNTSTFSGKMIISGNPRFDLLHPENRGIYLTNANRLCDKYGRYVLINTNFTNVNHKSGALRHVSADVKKYQRFLIQKFIDAIYKISGIGNIGSIIIRPHPSENPDFYREEFGETPAVVVEQSGDVREWIMGAEVVLHNSCTTGIESAMLNTPVLAFEPDNAPIESPLSSLPNTVSEPVTSVSDLVTRVEYYVANDENYQMDEEQTNMLQKYFANVNEPATPKIVKAVNEMASEKERSYGDNSVTRQIKEWVKHSSISPLVEIALRHDFGRSEYSIQKFPGLTIDEIRQRVSNFEEISQITNIKVEAVHPYYDIYWIYKY